MRIRHSRPANLILDASPKSSIEVFLNQLERLGVTDISTVRSAAEMTLRNLKLAKWEREVHQDERRLQRQWYGQLAHGTVDYSVYDTEYYLGDLWACWIAYSRKYILNALSPRSMGDHSVMDDLGEVRQVIDLGCGFGYTTAALQLLWPRACVVGTNLESVQARVARDMERQYGFQFKTTQPIFGHADVVFASEYFEHIENPIDHLRELVSLHCPRAWIIANSFGTRAIGHFETYFVHGCRVGEKRVSRLFNREMETLGYHRARTTMWNNKPAYWKRSPV